MQIYKLNYFNVYKFTYKLLPLLICCFLSACSGQNNTQQGLSIENPLQTGAPVININTASVEELEKLPHIGTKTAHEIVERREKFGRFRKPEHLLMMRRISDKEFRDIKFLIKAE